jgi:hypothetical protein
VGEDEDMRASDDSENGDDDELFDYGYIVSDEASDDEGEGQEEDDNGELGPEDGEEGFEDDPFGHDYAPL